MERICRSYLRHVRMIGAFYCIIPSLIWFVVVITQVPFREVYLLRLALSCVLGGAIAAWLHAFGVKMWMIKHLSPHGPATVREGILIGCAVGYGVMLFPPLTGLIATNHPLQAMWFVILAWLGATLLGGAIGGITSTIHLRYGSGLPVDEWIRTGRMKKESAS